MIVSYITVNYLLIALSLILPLLVSFFLPSCQVLMPSGMTSPQMCLKPYKTTCTNTRVRNVAQFATNCGNPPPPPPTHTHTFSDGKNIESQVLLRLILFKLFAVPESAIGLQYTTLIANINSVHISIIITMV